MGADQLQSAVPVVRWVRHRCRGPGRRYLIQNGDRRLEADVARRIGFGWRDRVTEYAAQHSAHPS